MTTFAQYLFYTSIPYIIIIIFFVIAYAVFVLNAYFLAASTKYEWERYSRIREMREQRNLEPDIVRNENE
jgi:predicted RND superfamily exporter protein